IVPRHAETVIDLRVAHLLAGRHVAAGHGKGRHLRVEVVWKRCAISHLFPTFFRGLSDEQHSQKTLTVPRIGGSGVRPASRTWLRRGGFAMLLLALAVAPGPASAARPCAGRVCQAAGQARWTEPLPGSWLAEPGLTGTTPAEGAAYAAAGRQLAVVGVGITVQAYRASTGTPLWVSSLAGVGAGAQIVS